jgi:hypothetical protein
LYRTQPGSNRAEGGLTIERDLEHLKLLAIFNYILAGISALGGCFPVLHLLAGVFIVSAASSQGQTPGAVAGIVFIGFAVVIILLAWGLAAVNYFAAQGLAHQKRYGYCKAIAVIQCFFFPLGTILGVFTLIVLQRDTVRELFDRNSLNI